MLIVIAQQVKEENEDCSEEELNDIMEKIQLNNGCT
jgi:hypothetical protein